MRVSNLSLTLSVRLQWCGAEWAYSIHSLGRLIQGIVGLTLGQSKLWENACILSKEEPKKTNKKKQQHILLKSEYETDFLEHTCSVDPVQTWDTYVSHLTLIVARQHRKIHSRVPRCFNNMMEWWDVARHCLAAAMVFWVVGYWVQSQVSTVALNKIRVK